MRLLAVVGHSDSGKTRLIQRLIPVFKARGLSVAVIKHCHRGFDWAPRGKDSARFLEAGADGVGLWSPDYRAALFRVTGEADVPEWISRQFGDRDVVLIEGGKGLRGVPKIEVRRHASGEALDIPAEEIRALVTEGSVREGVPHFPPHRIDDLADFLLDAGEEGGWN